MNEVKVKGSSIGQFDLIKGIGIICIVVDHSIGLFQKDLLFTSNVVGVMLGILFQLFNNMIIPAFFIISGYGFRIEPPSVSLKRQVKYLIIPYSVVMIVTAFLNLIIHYATFRYPKGAVMETAKVFGGFLLGAARNITIGKVVLFSNGACWYLLALFLSWMILELIFQYGGKRITLFVIVTVVAGWLLSMVCPETPYGIPQSMIAVGYLYAGYQIKKHHWLFQKWPIWQYIVMILVSLITIIWGYDDMASNEWKLGLLDIAVNAVYAVLFIRLILYLNRFKNILFSGVSYLGRMSLWIICIHTIELIAVPWYLLSNTFHSALIGIVVVLLCRSILITLGVSAILIRHKWFVSRKHKSGGMIWTE